MNEPLFDENFEKLFAAQQERGGSKSMGDGFILWKLIFGLGLLEEYLLNLCLPFLEENADRLLEAGNFIKDIKKLVHSLNLAINGVPFSNIIHVWNLVERQLASLEQQTSPKNVLLTVVGIIAVRSALENSIQSWRPIDVQRSKAHSSFQLKIKEICELNGSLLNGGSDDEELHKIAAAL